MDKKIILEQKNKEIDKLKEGIGICINKVYTAKTIEDADRKLEFLNDIRKQVNEFR